MIHTVRAVLEGLNPTFHTRVCVRRRVRNGMEYLGGGYSWDCIRRFGDMTVCESEIYENCLCIYVF